MLCVTDDGKGFILNPYYDELYKTEVSRRRRYYFKHGVLKVERHPYAKDALILRYKGEGVFSWWVDRENVVKARNMIAAVCRTLDIALGVNE